MGPDCGHMSADTVTLATSVMSHVIRCLVTIPEPRAHFDTFVVISLNICESCGQFIGKFRH